MHSLTVFLLAIILALPFVPALQVQEQSPPQEKMECGTVIPPGQLQFDLARRRASAATVINPPTAAPYHLPMTIHIVHRSDGTGGLLPGKPEVSMRDLNRMFQSAGIQFFIYGEIDHINDDTHFIIPNEDARRNALRQVNVVPNTINVYFTNLKGVGGQSTFSGSPIQGVLISNVNTGTESTPSVFAHEIGHYFDLYHTHDTVQDVECPNGNNCSTAGDLLCDTPADPNLDGRVTAGCAYDNSAITPPGCDMTPYNPPVRNLMSYSPQTCQSEFTPSSSAKCCRRFATPTIGRT